MEKWHLFEVRQNINQTYNQTINNRNISLYIGYNSADDTWNFDIYENNVPLICGLKVTLGYCNLDSYNVLSQYEYLNIGKLYFYKEDIITPNRETLNKIIINWVY